MENDFKFNYGKYKSKLLSEVNDKNYILYCYNNFKLNQKNKIIFLKRLEELNIFNYNLKSTSINS